MSSVKKGILLGVMIILETPSALGHSFLKHPSLLIALSVLAVLLAQTA